MHKLTFFALFLALSSPALFAQEAGDCAGCATKHDDKAELPSAESIMDKSIAAVGGAEAIKKIKSTVMKGTIDMGMSMKLTIYAAEPNLTKTEMEIPGMGKMMNGYDGKNGWSYSAMQGPAIMGAKEAEQTKEGASFAYKHDWKAQYSKVEATGIEAVAGEDCYKVVATSKSGMTSTHYYSVKTGLLARMDSKNETPMGSMDIQMVFKDYKDIGGVKFPHKMTQNAMGQAIAITFTEIKTNVDIPSSTFEPPDEVKALLDK
jgi:outer membrane lipoprotein-sorting protein